MEIDRAFAESPILPDSEVFALRVTQRLDRGWTFRQMLIGGLGLAGGLIGAGQVLGSGLLSRFGALTSQSDALVRSSLARLPVARTVSEVLYAGAHFDGQVLWMSAAMAALAVGLFVTRAIRDI